MALKGQKPDDRLLPYRWATILQFQYRFKDNFGFASVVRVWIETTRRCWNLTTTWLSRWSLFSWNYFQKRELGWDPLQEKEGKSSLARHHLYPFVVFVDSNCYKSNKMFTLEFFKNPCFYTNNKPEIAFQQRSNKKRFDLEMWWT